MNGARKVAPADPFVQPLPGPREWDVRRFDPDDSPEALDALAAAKEAEAEAAAIMNRAQIEANAVVAERYAALQRARESHTQKHIRQDADGVYWLHRPPHGASPCPFPLPFTWGGQKVYCPDCYQVTRDADGVDWLHQAAHAPCPTPQTPAWQGRMLYCTTCHRCETCGLLSPYRTAYDRRRLPWCLCMYRREDRLMPWCMTLMWSVLAHLFAWVADGIFVFSMVMFMLGWGGMALYWSQKVWDLVPRRRGAEYKPMYATWVLVYGQCAVSWAVQPIDAALMAMDSAQMGLLIGVRARMVPGTNFTREDGTVGHYLALSGPNDELAWWCAIVLLAGVAVAGTVRAWTYPEVMRPADPGNTREP